MKLTLMCIVEKLEAGDYLVAQLGMESEKFGCRNSLPWVGVTDNQ